LDWCVPDSVGSTASDIALWEQLSQALAAQYELEHEVGRGGMGIVYRARDRRLKRPVAIKLLPPELAFRAEIRTRFLREAETAAQLSHPNIVPIYTVGEQNGLVFFVMALVEGDTVASALVARGLFSPDSTRRVLREVADALAYAHARGVVHRDIKPDNILLDAETGRAVVTDFGIARAMTGEDGGEGTTGPGSISRLTATGIAIGTPAYMSPEQSAGERSIDGRSDLYSLGVVGYQMLCGEPPFTASNTPALLMKHLTETPVSISERRADVPPELGRAIMMLLAKEPDNRFPSAAALAAALEPGSAAAEDARVRHDAASSVAGVPAYSPTGQRQALRTGPTWGDMQAGSGGSSSLPEELIYQPTEDELRRWHAVPVMKFRRRLAYYVSVNLVVALLAILGSRDFLGLTGMWSVYMAFQYAKLWSDGFDWRDVFRQPRHREILDVASEAIDDASALFDRNKRQQIRDRARRRIGMGERTPTTPGGGQMSTSPSLSQAPRTGGAAPPADTSTPVVIRQAEMDRDEILRIVESLPRSERSKIPEVVASANALVERIRSLSASVIESGRDGPGIGAVEIDEEITQLESEANPLDRVASEKRVRRLAFLKRQRRAVADVEQRRSQAAARLEGCAMALQSMRLDVLRLRAGALSHQHITSIAEQALTLARDVDSAMYVADEMARLTGRDPTALRPDRA
jgi:serine/threonine-protein kinase